MFFCSLRIFYVIINKFTLPFEQKMVKKFVNLSAEEITAYCLRFKLSPQNTPPYDLKTRYYYTEKEILSLKIDKDGNQAYSEEQINKLIFRNYSKNTVQAIINLHEKLIEFLSPDSIFKIASHDGGSKNLEAVQTAFEALRGLGFSVEQVVKIASHDGGSKNIEAVQTAFEALRGLGFNTEQVVKIASHDGGSKNIEAVKTAFEALRGLGFSAEQVVKIVSHIGGSKNLEAVQTAFEALRGLGFSAEQVVKIVSHGGGSKNIEAVKTAFDGLIGLGFSAEQVVEIASHIGGSKNIEAVQTAFEALRSLGFSAEQVVKIVSHIGGSKNLEAVQTAFKALRALGFNAEQVVKIASHGGGSKNIEAVQQALDALIALGFNAEQVVKIASHGGGSKNIEAVQAVFDALHGLGFSAEQVVKIASHDGGSKNLEVVQQAFAALKGLGFNAKQVVKIASHDGGSKNLEAVQEAFEPLRALGFTADQVVRMASHGGGSKNLEALIVTIKDLNAKGKSFEQFGLNIQHLVDILSNNGGHFKLKKVFQNTTLLFNLGFSMADIVKAVHLPVSHWAIMVKFIHELRTTFSPEQIIQLSKNKTFKENIHNILSDMPSNHLFNFTEEEIKLLSEIFSEDNASNNLQTKSAVAPHEIIDDSLVLEFLKLFDEEIPIEQNVDNEHISLGDEHRVDHPSFEHHHNVLIATSPTLIHSSMFNQKNNKRSQHDSLIMPHKLQRKNTEDAENQNIGFSNICSCTMDINYYSKI
jgi:Holliday junction resolvasome RuvABC DNA-binding subunit